MTTWIGLLRGVNVGGSHALAMADVRRVFTDGGATSVATYIQSGNVVFQHAERSAAPLIADLEKALARAAGFSVPVVLRTLKEWQAMTSANPWDVTDPKLIHVVLFSAKISKTDIPAIDPAAYEPETFVVRPRELYLSLPNGMGRAKLPKLLARVMRTGTARNWSTIVKLEQMAASL